MVLSMMKNICYRYSTPPGLHGIFYGCRTSCGYSHLIPSGLLMKRTLYYVSYSTPLGLLGTCFVLPHFPSTSSGQAVRLFIFNPFGIFIEKLTIMKNKN